MPASSAGALVYGRAMPVAWSSLAPLVLLALLFSGCASTPRGGGSARGGSDGPGANPPPNLAQVADAEPRVEAVRGGGPNKPYEVFGRGYAPLTGDPAFTERGLASWYGRKFHGRPTSSGEPYDMYAMTAAHKTMPIPSYARVRNPANGREVIVRINDRGPFHAGRVIDLSYTAALKLGLLNAVAPVEVERITLEAIRSGSWRGGEGRALASTTAPAGPPPAAVATTSPVAASPGIDVVAVANADNPPIEVASDAANAADSTPDPPRAAPTPITASPPGYWMQLGAFRERDGALDFQRKVERELEWLAPLMAVFIDRDLHRLQAGPYASRGEAQLAAERLRTALQLVPMIVERR